MNLRSFEQNRQKVNIADITMTMTMQEKQDTKSVLERGDGK